MDPNSSGPEIEKGGIILSIIKKRKCHRIGKDKHSMCLKQMPLILKEKDKHSIG